MGNALQLNACALFLSPTYVILRLAATVCPLRWYSLHRHLRLNPLMACFLLS